MVHKYCGDCNTTDSHTLHKIKITKPQAEMIVKTICEHYKISIPKVVFTGKKTRRNMGNYNRKLELIRLQAHPEGESVGCFIHELAHHVANKQFKGTGRLQSHGFEFKNTQRLLIQYVSTHAKELNIPGLDESVFVTFNHNVAKQLTAAPTDTRPVLTITSPTVIKIPRKASDNLMNSRNFSILYILRASKGMTKEDVGKAVNTKLGISRASWDTPMYELKKAGLVDYDPKTKTYSTTDAGNAAIHGGK